MERLSGTSNRGRFKQTSYATTKKYCHFGPRFVALSLKYKDPPENFIIVTPKNK